MSTFGMSNRGPGIVNVVRMAHLQFQYLDWPAPESPDWKDLPADFGVQLLVGKNASSGRQVGSTVKTDAKGRSKLQLPPSVKSGEFVYFRLVKRKDSVSPLIPWPWSSFANRAMNGTLGRVKDLTVSVGTEDDPLVFRLGVYCEVEVKYKVGGAALPHVGTHPVPEGTEVAVAQSFPGEEKYTWLDVYQCDPKNKRLFRNTFRPSPCKPRPDHEHQGVIPPSESSPCGPDHVGEKAAEDSYGWCCALAAGQGKLRFLLSDLDWRLDEVQKSYIEVTVFPRLHDTKYGTEPVEFTSLSSIGELVDIIADVNLDTRLSHTFKVERDTATTPPQMIWEVKPSAQVVPDDRELLRAGLYLMKVGRHQNQVMFRLTGGKHRGVPDHRIKLIEAAFDAQRPFCAPSLGVHYVYQKTADLWRSDSPYTVAHERGHDIMWHELSIPRSTVIWQFLLGLVSNADGAYTQDHWPSKETTPLTALYDGWADFFSMFTDWSDGSRMRRSALGPTSIQMTDRTTASFPNSSLTDLNNNPSLCNLGERCEGVVSNFLWKLWVDICGGSRDYSETFVRDKWLTEEHLDEAEFPQKRCDLFRQFLWRPFKHFWTDESGQCHADDCRAPSIRDFVDSVEELNSDPADKAIVDEVLEHAHERMISKPEAAAALEFQYWDRANTRWIPMPCGIRVEAWDADPISPDDFQGEGLIEPDGRVVILIPKKDESEPDIYFRVMTESRVMPDGRPSPPFWSTRDADLWRYDGSGKLVKTKAKGFYDEFRMYQIGQSRAAPDVFRFG